MVCLIKDKLGDLTPLPIYLFLKDVLCVYKGPFLEVDSLLPPVGSGHQTQVIRPLPSQLRLLRLVFRSILASCFCGHHVPSVNTEHKAFSLAFTCRFGECALR